MKDDLSTTIGALGDLLRERGMVLCTAESCTGGLIAGALTDVAGSSDWFCGSVVAYANAVKESLLGVPAEVLAAHGAVSEAVVLAMARGACAALGADCGVAVSGVAGPGGGTPDKPVGTVWAAWSVAGHVDARLFSFAGDRAQIRARTVRAAVEGLVERLRRGGGDAAVCGSGAAG